MTVETPRQDKTQIWQMFLKVISISQMKVTSTFSKAVSEQISDNDKLIQAFNHIKAMNFPQLSHPLNDTQIMALAIAQIQQYNDLDTIIEVMITRAEKLLQRFCPQHTYQWIEPPSFNEKINTGLCYLIAFELYELGAHLSKITSQLTIFSEKDLQELFCDIFNANESFRAQMTEQNLMMKWQQNSQIPTPPNPLDFMLPHIADFTDQNRKNLLFIRIADLFFYGFNHPVNLLAYFPEYVDNMDLLEEKTFPKIQTTLTHSFASAFHSKFLEEQIFHRIIRLLSTKDEEEINFIEQLIEELAKRPNFSLRLLGESINVAFNTGTHDFSPALNSFVWEGDSALYSFSDMTVSIRDYYNLLRNKVAEFEMKRTFKSKDTVTPQYTTGIKIKANTETNELLNIKEKIESINKTRRDIYERFSAHPVSQRINTPSLRDKIVWSAIYISQLDILRDINHRELLIHFYIDYLTKIFSNLEDKFSFEVLENYLLKEVRVVEHLSHLVRSIQSGDLSLIRTLYVQSNIAREVFLVNWLYEWVKLPKQEFYDKYSELRNMNFILGMLRDDVRVFYLLPLAFIVPLLTLEDGLILLTNKKIEKLPPRKFTIFFDSLLLLNLLQQFRKSVDESLENL